MLTDKQKWAMKRSDARLNIWDGSVRSGKSYNCNFRFLAAITEDKKGMPPGTIDCAIGKTLGALKRNVINPIIELVGTKNAKYYSGKQELHVFGNVIDTIGANDERSVGKIQGATIRKCIGDELTLWPESFFKMMDTRLSTNKSQFFGNTNPGAPNHYIKKEYLDRSGQINLKSFHFVIDDNTTLDPEYVKAMKLNFSGLWYNRYILGLWSLAEGAIYDFFNDMHTIIISPQATYYFLAIDYGTNNPFAAILFGVNRFTTPMVWAEHEFYYDSKKHQSQLTDKEYGDRLEMFCKEHLGEHWRTKIKRTILDPSASSFEAELKQRRFSGVMHAENDVSDGLRFKASMLKSGKYAIHTRCKNYIESFASYSWDSKKQLLGIDAPLKVDDHLQDAGRYGIFTEFGHNNNFVNYSAMTRAV